MSKTNIPLPSLICIGFGKAGTTSLWYGLSRHPRICLYKGKETHFFNSDENYCKGLNYYRESYFADFGELNEVTIDITPAYISNRKFLERIKVSLEDSLNICVIFRHPVMRSFSHYTHSVRNFEIQSSILNSDELFYVDSEHLINSQYERIMPAVYELFGKGQVLPLIFERDIEKNGPLPACNKVAEILGLPLMDKLDFNEKAGAGYEPNITVLEKDAILNNPETSEVMELKCGSIVIEHELIPAGYRVEVIESPTETQTNYYKNYIGKVTKDLNLEQIGKIAEEQFKKTIDYVRETLDDPIPEWNLENLRKKEYKTVKTRIEF